MVFNQH